MSVVSVIDDLVGIQGRLAVGVAERGFDQALFASSKTELEPIFARLFELDTSGMRTPTGPIGDVLSATRSAHSSLEQLAGGHAHGADGAREALQHLGTAISHLPFVR